MMFLRFTGKSMKNMIRKFLNVERKWFYFSIKTKIGITKTIYKTIFCIQSHCSIRSWWLIVLFLCCICNHFSERVKSLFLVVLIGKMIANLYWGQYRTNEAVVVTHAELCPVAWSREQFARSCCLMNSALLNRTASLVCEYLIHRRPWQGF